MTLRNLSTSTPLNLQEWLFIAKRANLDIDADTVLTGAHTKALQEECRRYMLLKQHVQKQRQEVAQEKEKPEQEPAPNSAEDDSSKEAKAIQALDRLVKENQIFVDLSSLIAPQSLKAWENLVPVLHKYNRKLRIPKSVLSGLIACGRDKENAERAELANNSLAILQKLNNEGLVDIRESVDANSTPARDLMTFCAHFRMDCSLLIITQDPDLTKDLLEQNTLQSANGKTIFIKKFNKYGYVSNVIDKPTTNGGSNYNNNGNNHNNNGHNHNNRPPFYVAKQIRQEPDQVLKTTKIPTEGDLIYTNASCTGPIRLESRLGGGGEGTVYATNTNYVAKVYKAECCTAYRREKILKLVEARLAYEGICFPVTALYNEYGEFVGYLMQKAQGEMLRHSVMMKGRMMTLFPDWNKADVVQLCITILYKIKYIHDNGLLLGDINPQNILVKSPLEVYFVDTDSYQVNDLPCPVGVPTYTAPELIQMQKDGKYQSYSELLRTKANENFAVATLLFMILMPGRNPYAHAGGGSPVDNILTMHFPYALGEKRSDRTPGGAWRFIWSHLPYRVKETFHQTFTKQEGKSDYNMKERLSVYRWIMVMIDYREKLQRVAERMNEYNAAVAAGRLDPKKDPPPEDEQDLWLYPDRLRWALGKDTHVMRLCKACGQWSSFKKDSRQECCAACQNKGETIVCEACGEEFIFSDYDKSQGRKRPRFCRSCNSKRYKVVYEGTCEMPGCFNNVSLTAGQVEWFEKNNLPKVCDFCKKNNKAFGRYLTKSNSGERSAPRNDRRPTETPTPHPVRKERPTPVPPASSRPATTPSDADKKHSLLQFLWKGR